MYISRIDGVQHVHVLYTYNIFGKKTPFKYDGGGNPDVMSTHHKDDHPSSVHASSGYSRFEG